MGKKNYFNPINEICEKVQICKNNEEYDYETNSCRIPLDDYIEKLPKFNSSDYQIDQNQNNNNKKEEDNKILIVN